MVNHNITSKMSLMLGVAVIFMVAAWAGDNECYVLRPEMPCLPIGSPCSAYHQGTSHAGVITWAEGQIMCSRGAPGNRKCEGGNVDRVCTYTCTIIVEGLRYDIEQAQMQKVPVLSGRTCQADG